MLCLAYVLGVLLADVPGVAYGWLVFAGLAAWGVPRLWRGSPRGSLWFAAGLVGFFATLYVQARTPQPTATDVSQFAGRETTVRGVLLESPSLNRKRDLRFVLEVTSLPKRQPPQPASGKLYVTLPRLQGTGLHPGMTASITGWLYEPQPPQNPSGFDFRAYLARQGIFAGMKGYQLDWDSVEASQRWGWWRWRDRIVRTLVERLDVPRGTLVGAMVLGRRAVDLPDDISESFRAVGLAHALAASGFHVSLILGTVLGLGRRLSDRGKFALGTATLLLYVGLVGAQPSVLRAALMGFAGLIGLVTGRRVNPAGALLVAATLLLLVNPLWIRDLGFQLSFLATLGLLVTVPPLVERLDWLPPTLSPLLAVPLAAIAWTLPLQLYAFGQIPTYSLFANLLATPLLSLVTLGGFLCAIAALVLPPLGRVLAWGLALPVQGLLALVAGIDRIPNGAIAVRPLDLWQLLLLYGLLGVLWGASSQRRFGVKLVAAAVLALAVVTVPAVAVKANLLRVTVLAAERPAIALQQGWNTSIVHDGTLSVTQYGVLPFLQQDGVVQPDAAIATPPRSDETPDGWRVLSDRRAPRQFYRLYDRPLPVGNGGTFLPPNTDLTQDEIRLRSLSDEVLALQLQVAGSSWLILGDLSRAEQQQLLREAMLSPVEILLFFGRSLEFDLLDVLQPQTAIAARELDPNSQRKLGQLGATRRQLDREGALQWTREDGLRSALEPEGEF